MGISCSIARACWAKASCITCNPRAASTSGKIASWCSRFVIRRRTTSGTAPRSSPRPRPPTLHPTTGPRLPTLPTELARDKSYPIFQRQFSDHLYRVASLALWSCDPLEQFSKPGEKQEDFRARLASQASERRDAERAKVSRDVFAKS